MQMHILGLFHSMLTLNVKEKVRLQMYNVSCTFKSHLNAVNAWVDSIRINISCDSLGP